MKRLYSISGKTVAVTGRCWIDRKQFSKVIKSCGGRVSPGGNVTSQTDVLVRGHSPRWVHGDFGRKDEHAAKCIQNGQDILIVDDDELRKLVENGKSARCSDRLVGQPIDWLSRPPSEKAYKKIARMTGSLDREYTAKGRTEQAFLRSQIFKGEDQFECALCGQMLPIELLVAAHIKPRSACTFREKVDVPNIVFPLCQLGCDALYERGLTSVDYQGKIVTVWVAPGLSWTVYRGYLSPGKESV